MVVSCASKHYVSSDRVEQRVIFPSYEIKYDYEQQEGAVQVIFHVDNHSGQTVRLKGESKVTFNDTCLEGHYSKEDGYVYARSLNALPSRWCFIYTNNDRQQFKNTFRVSGIDMAGKRDITFRKHEAAVFATTGALRGEETSARLLLFNNKGQQITAIAVTLRDRQGWITPEAMLAVPEGHYTGQLSTTCYSSDIKAMDRGGAYETRCLSKKMKIHIVK
jgi:hypothetical protein